MALGAFRQSESLFQMPKCSECGYLSVRQHRGSFLIEASQPYRDKITNEGIGTENKFDVIPICFVAAANLKQEINGNTEPASIKKFLESNRDCTSFTDWYEGYSPKEHIELNLHKAIQERAEASDLERREWNAAQALLQDERIKAREERDHDWREKDKKDSNRVFVIASIVVPVMLIIAQVIVQIMTTRMQIEATMKAAMANFTLQNAPVEKTDGKTEPPLSPAQ